MYDNIMKACLEISYCNGGINRYRVEKKVSKQLKNFIASRPYQDELPAIDIYLGTLNEAELELVCDGEESEREAFMSNAPPFCDTMLNEWFEEC